MPSSHCNVNTVQGQSGSTEWQWRSLRASPFSHLVEGPDLLDASIGLEVFERHVSDDEARPRRARILCAVSRRHAAKVCLGNRTCARPSSQRTAGGSPQARDVPE
jgi:hypothetical protein